MHFRDDYRLGWNGRLFDTRLSGYEPITSPQQLDNIDFSGLAAWRRGLAQPVLAADARFLAWRFLAHPTRRYELRLRAENLRALGYVAVARNAKSGMDVILDWQGDREFAEGPAGRFMRPAFVSDARHAPAIAHPKLIKRIPLFATGFAVSDVQRAASWDAVSLAACDFL